MSNTNTKDNLTVYVIMGVTGDLAYKKVIPSLWHLYTHNHLPEKYKIVGFARRYLGEDLFKKLIKDSITDHNNGLIDEDEFDSFFDHFLYQSGDFGDLESFKLLQAKINSLHANTSDCINKVFYLATPPNVYGSIFKNLAEAGLNTTCEDKKSWTRILIEKPFGSDLQSSKELEKLLSQYFTEDQIYRIDHYLFKEIIQGIENFRFSNNLFENTWDNTTIEKIEIKLFEKIGVENRGSFYDSVGTLRDVGQNHLLAMLAAVVSESPASGDTDSFQNRREDVLALLPKWTDDLVQKNTKRAQYVGYADIDGVNENSKTETYFSVQTTLTGSKWDGVTVYMQAGKMMNEVRKEIVITLKHPKVCLLCEEGEHKPNQIIFRFDPNDEIKIIFYSKKPGFKHLIEEREFTFFLYEKETKIQYVEEYSKVFFNVVEGDKSRFVSVKEVEFAWQFVDPVLSAWKQDKVILDSYQKNTPVYSQNLLKEKQKGEIAIIGLGKMGANLAKRLLDTNWKVIGFNRSPEATVQLKECGLDPAYSIEEVVQKMQPHRTIWIMTPYQATDDVIKSLIPLLNKGDTIIDGGNSNYKDTIRRNTVLQEHNINFIDVGVSGGPEGALNGACLMIGGEKSIYESYENLFADLSVSNGYKYVGSSGAGHFVKMVHNGIEYGMMQSIGEGFEVLKKSSFDLNVLDVAEIYNHGSVIESRLIGWLAQAYSKFTVNLDKEECCSGVVSHSGEGQWTVDTAKEMNIDVPIIEGSLEFRKQSQNNPSYTGQVVSALRHEFGRHDTSKKHENK